MTLQYWNAWVSPDSTLWRQFHAVTLKRPSRAGFLNLGTVDSLSWIILFCGDCPVHCRRFNSNPGFYVLNISSISPAGTTKNVSWHCQTYSGGNPFPASPDENHTDLGREQPTERGPLNINDLIWDFPKKTNLRV